LLETEGKYIDGLFIIKRERSVQRNIVQPDSKTAVSKKGT